MNLFFFQNCISPHQIPFIEELSVFTDVDRVVVIAPRVDYDDRKLMGWKTSKLLETKGIEFLITPTMKVVQRLYEEWQRTVSAKKRLAVAEKPNARFFQLCWLVR